MRNIVKLEIIGVFPTFYTICKGGQLAIPACGLSLINEIFKEYPDEVKETYKETCALALNLNNYFGRSIEIKAIDPSTPQGIWKSLKYRVKQYPTFVINGKRKIVGIPSYEEIKMLILDELKVIRT